MIEKKMRSKIECINFIKLEKSKYIVNCIQM